MPNPRTSSRQRLIRAALSLFAEQGITDTTTKQISEAAGVNEATLFRQFGNKHGLLLAVLQEGDVFQRLSQVLVHQAERNSKGASDFADVLRIYATAFLHALDQVPELVRSLIGEAGRYPDENRVALGQGFTQANQCVATYFAKESDRHPIPSSLSPNVLASMIHNLLLGYAAVELTSDNHGLWSSRVQFVEQLVTLLCQPAPLASAPAALLNTETSESDIMTTQALPALVIDLPASLVHEILLRAKKRGPQPYAIVYTLFGAGVSPEELIDLERSHHISNRDQHLLQITHGKSRQVPINQWIMGKRYGTYQKNPLTQWLRSRKDEEPSLFVAQDQTPLTLPDLQTLWTDVTDDLSTLAGQSPQIAQTQQTWCVELLMRGVTPENMQILTGWTLDQLNPYMQRAVEKAAIDQAMQLDKKN